MINLYKLVSSNATQCATQIDQPQLADGGCRETDSDENINYLISDLGNATYDEQEVARVLHAM
jgi:hypothetical protein